MDGKVEELLGSSTGRISSSVCTLTTRKSEMTRMSDVSDLG